MAGEFIRIDARAKMAQAALRLAKEAKPNFRENLRAELEGIARETESLLRRVHRIAVKRRRKNGEYQPNDGGGGVATRLLRANADILIEYHLLEDETYNTSRDIASSSSQGALVSSISDPTSHPAPIEPYSESEDTNSWLQDSDDEEETVSKQRTPDPSRSGSISPSLAPGTSSHLMKASSTQEQSLSEEDTIKQESRQEKEIGRESVSGFEVVEVLQDSRGISSAALVSRLLSLFPPTQQVQKESRSHLEKAGKADTDDTDADAGPDLSRRYVPFYPNPASQWERLSEKSIDLEKNKGSERELTEIARLHNLEGNRNLGPRNFPVQQASTSQWATTSESQAGLGPERYRLPSWRRSSVVPDLPLARPDVPHPASSSTGPGWAPGGDAASVPWYPQPPRGSEGFFYMSPQTPGHDDSPEGFQQYSPLATASSPLMSIVFCPSPRTSEYVHGSEVSAALPCAFLPPPQEILEHGNSPQAAQPSFGQSPPSNPVAPTPPDNPQP